MPSKCFNLAISELSDDSTVLADSEYVPGPASLLKYSLSSSLPSNRCTFEPNKGTCLLLELLTKLEKVFDD